MFDDAAKIMNQNFFYPVVFIAACIFLFIVFGSLLYFKFLSRWIPEIFAKLVAFVGCVYILILCTSHYNWIKSSVVNWTLSKVMIGFFILIVLFAVAVSFLFKPKNKTTGKIVRASKNMKKKNMTHRVSTAVRPDEIILQSSLDELSGFEFERLLAMYFRDRGYAVKEVGVGGNDGGVDLVITDQRGEKTAVQAKCYSNHNNVGVQTVRELVAAKRNHDCILSLLITTSDFTQQAMKEAEQFKVDYWHGGVVEQKLASWGKWQPSKKKQIEHMRIHISTARSQTAATTETMICRCGAAMVIRKNKQGEQFWGCSNFPKCRHTRTITMAK